MDGRNRVHVSIVAIAIFNFSWLVFNWLNPSWRTVTDALPSAHMAGFDVYGISALTALLICLGIIQLFRHRTHGNAIPWKVDVLVVLAWVITYASIIVSNLPTI
jgi:hypothetical protein